jgi:hypothetical protein
MDAKAFEENTTFIFMVEGSMLKQEVPTESHSTQLFITKAKFAFTQKKNCYMF